MRPLLSVIVPCRNDVKKLPRLLDSILEQRFRDLEVVIVDDASDEGYADILTAYSNKGLDIRVLESRERLYTKMARLKGVEAAQGRVLLFADADDILWGNEALEANIGIFLEHEADIVHFPSVVTDNQGRFQRYFSCADPLALELSGQDILAGFIRSQWEGCVIWNKLFSRKLWLDWMAVMADNPIKRYSEDFFLNIYSFMGAASYIGSQHIGYGFYCVNAKYADRYIHNAVACLQMLDYIPAIMASQKFPVELIEYYRQKIFRTICLFAGRAAINAERDEAGIPTDGGIQRLLDIDLLMLLKVMLIGNSLNGKRLIAICKMLSGEDNSCAL